jgi:hypothetical protein
MKLNRHWVAAAALIASLPCVKAGDITGKITLKGTPPPEKVLPLDPNCGALYPAGDKPTTRFYAVGKNGELADVFVYVKDGLSGKTFEPPETPVLLDQKGCEYHPYIGALQTGQKLLVRNSDPVLHNIHPTPAVAGNREQNVAQLPKSKDMTFTFPKEEVLLRIKCDVHPWMFAYFGVVDHPFYAVTGEDGTFKLTGLPPGKYTIEAYHRKGGKQTAEVEVPATGAKEQDFTFQVK